MNDVINIEVGVIPPVRKWFYTQDTNRLVASRCASLRNDFHKLNEAEKQIELVETFKEQLNMISELSYGEESTYTIKMTLLDNGYYGFKVDEIKEFGQWYVELLERDMIVNGNEFRL